MTAEKTGEQDPDRQTGKGSRSNKRERTGALAVFVCFLVASAVMAWFAWETARETNISGHGLAAMILGGVLTLGLGIGLMFLVFLSNRRGYDEQDRHL